jgi:hypothetical protein
MMNMTPFNGGFCCLERMVFGVDESFLLYRSFSAPANDLGRIVKSITSNRILLYDGNSRYDIQSQLR